MRAEDIYRKWVEEGIRRLKPFQSKSTRFLFREPPFFGVSLEENLLFILLLFRKKHLEDMMEARELLQRLLTFQNKNEKEGAFGSFPSDLLEYPACHDRYLSARIKLILDIILQDFAAILGKELELQVVTALSILQVQEEPLENISLGRQLAALSCFSENQELVERACSFWDERWGVFCGPAYEIYHYGTEPVCTLFDCWMSLHTECNMSRSWIRKSFLELALLKPGAPLSQPPKKSIEGDAYSVFYLPQGTVAAALHQPRSHLLQGYTPLRFVSQKASVAWYFPKGKLLSLKKEGNTFHGVVERTKTTEATLFEIYVERLSGVQILPASLFNPLEGAVIQIGDVFVKTSFLSHAMESVGLVGMGNRPSQLADVKEEAFDWVVRCNCIRGDNREHFAFTVAIS